MNSPVLPSIVAIALAYLVGAVPFGFLIARLFKGVDVREHGSGNIGATNVGRVIGRPWGVLALICDILKGFLPVFLAAWYMDGLDWGGACPSTPVVLCGAAAICGHVWPVYLRLKGGKGVATSCGVLLYLEPLGTAIAVAVWIAAVAIWRYVSLGSILAALTLVGYVLVMAPRRGGGCTALIVFGIAMASVVIVRHRSNIKLLLEGTENRVGGKKRQEVAEDGEDTGQADDKE